MATADNTTVSQVELPVLPSAGTYDIVLQTMYSIHFSSSHRATQSSVLYRPNMQLNSAFLYLFTITQKTHELTVAVFIQYGMQANVRTQFDPEQIIFQELGRC
jgi:hypothetical protein